MTGEATVATANHEAEAPADRLGMLFDAHHQRLYRLARRLSGSADEARDLVQETFLRAARAPGALPLGASAEEAWLVRVLVNLCRDRWRRKKTRERLDRSPQMPPAAESLNPEAALVAHSIVWDALERLDPRRRAVVVMYELEGTPIDVIARTLGVTRVTVRWHLSKGRRELAAAITGKGGKP